MTANSVHFDQDKFGEDAEVFRPERWLDEKRAAVMSRHDLTFGFGNHVCIGRHITMAEMYKLLPALLHEYEFKFSPPDREWKVWHGWFQHQKDVFVQASKR